MRKNVVRFMAILTVMVMGISILGTGVCVGARAVQYITKQNFPIGMAIGWSWDDFRQDLRKAIGKNDKDDGYFEARIVVEDVKYLIKH